MDGVDRQQLDGRNAERVQVSIIAGEAPGRKRAAVALAHVLGMAGS
jgi:hypothetical protein